MKCRLFTSALVGWSILCPAVCISSMLAPGFTPDLTRSDHTRLLDKHLDCLGVGRLVMGDQGQNSIWPTLIRIFVRSCMKTQYSRYSYGEPWSVCKYVYTICLCADLILEMPIHLIFLWKYNSDYKIDLAKK